MLTKYEVDILKQIEREHPNRLRCACGKAITFHDESRETWVHEEGYQPSERVPGMWEVLWSDCPFSGGEQQTLGA